MPTSAPHLIFDRALLRRRLARAHAAGAADFLLAAALDEMRDRLSVVQRTFTAIADVGTPLPDLAAALAAERPDAQVVRLAPLPVTVALSPVLSVVGDEEILPLRPATFDLVVSVLVLQSVNDLPGALLQIRGLLRPDGLFLGCLLGGRSLSELRSALTAAETELVGGVSPRVAPFADVRDMGGLLQRAGLALPVVDSDALTVRYPHAFALMHDLRAMGATNILAARARRPTPRRLLIRAAEIYAERFSDADGRVRATFELLFLSGWAPHDSQQKPLKPGSARMRLADALRSGQRSD